MFFCEEDDVSDVINALKALFLLNVLPALIFRRVKVINTIWYEKLKHYQL